jgi:hypothetical protein
VDTVSAALPSHNKPGGRKAAYYRRDVDRQRKCRLEVGKDQVAGADCRLKNSFGNNFLRTFMTGMTDMQNWNFI